MIRTLYDPTHPRRDEAHLHDLLGEMVLRSVKEPAFENLERLCPAMRETRTVIGLKHYPTFIGLDWDGTLNRGGIGYLDGKADWQCGPLDILLFKVGATAVKIRDLGWERTARTLDNGLPLVTTRVEHEGIRYEQTVFAYSASMSSERDMRAAIRWSVQNTSRPSRRFALELWANPRAEKRLKRVSGLLKPGETRAFHWNVLYVNSHKRRELTALPGYPSTNALFQAWDIQPRVQSMTGRAFEQARTACRAFWENLLNDGTQIVTPEKRVNDAFKAWRVYNYLNTRAMTIAGKPVDVPHDGSGFYGDLYGITALSLIDALILNARFEEARDILLGLRSYQRKDGLFMHKYGLCDNGLFLSLIARYGLYSGDRHGFRRLLPSARKAAAWVRANRCRDKSEKDGIRYGLLHGKFTADMQVEDYAYVSDAYNWLGIKDLADALRRVGDPAAAKEYEREARAYRADILASMRKASFPETELFASDTDYAEGSFAWRHRAITRRGRLTVVPMTPVSRLLEHKFLGGYYYAFAAGEFLETELLPVSDPLYRNLTAYMEQRGGILLGLQRWCEYTGIDHAYTYGYLLNKIREGKTPQVLLGFYAMLAYGMDRDTFAGTEVVDLLGGKPHYGNKYHYQPHTLSNTHQIRLLRMMLVKEEGDELQIAFTAPSSWFADLRIEHAATRWGTVRYRVRRQGDRVKVDFALTPNGSECPRTIRLRVRHPDGSPIGALELNGKPYNGKIPTDGVIRLTGKVGNGSGARP